jgi:hypothetical protein
VATPVSVTGATAVTEASTTPGPVDTSTSFRRGETVTITSAAPIFVTPRDSQPPLIVASIGSVFRIVGLEDEWYRVAFPDSQYGERVGFVSKRNARRTAMLEPMDLSIPGARSIDMKPVDLSIPDAKAGSLKPVDLSIK